MKAKRYRRFILSMEVLMSETWTPGQIEEWLLEHGMVPDGIVQVATVAPHPTQPGRERRKKKSKP